MSHSGHQSAHGSPLTDVSNCIIDIEKMLAELDHRQQEQRLVPNGVPVEHTRHPQTGYYVRRLASDASWLSATLKVMAIQPGRMHRVSCSYTAELWQQEKEHPSGESYLCRRAASLGPAH